MKRTFSREFLVNELDLPWSDAAVEDRILGKGRWSTHHELVFQHEGKYYRTTYTKGATEMQEERPWEYEKDVECEEVTQIPVTVMKWVPVNG